MDVSNEMKIPIIIHMVLTVVRCFSSVFFFLSLLFCFILICREQVIPGYIFLFSGSNSEQENRDEKDENVEDSEASQRSYTTKSSQVENNMNILPVSQTQANDNQDLYEILDIPRIASQDEIRQAYKNVENTLSNTTWWKHS